MKRPLLSLFTLLFVLPACSGETGAVDGAVKSPTTVSAATSYKSRGGPTITVPTTITPPSVEIVTTTAQTLQVNSMMEGIDALTAMSQMGICNFVVVTSMSDEEFGRGLGQTVGKIINSANHCGANAKVRVSHERAELAQLCNEPSGDYKAAVITFEGCPKR